MLAAECRRSAARNATSDAPGSRAWRAQAQPPWRSPAGSPPAAAPPTAPMCFPDHCCRRCCGGRHRRPRQASMCRWSNSSRPNRRRHCKQSLGPSRQSSPCLKWRCGSRRSSNRRLQRPRQRTLSTAATKRRRQAGSASYASDARFHQETARMIHGHVTRPEINADCNGFIFNKAPFDRRRVLCCHRKGPSAALGRSERRLSRSQAARAGRSGSTHIVPLGMIARHHEFTDFVELVGDVGPDQHNKQASV